MKKNILVFISKAKKNIGILSLGVATIAGASSFTAFKTHAKQSKAQFAAFFWFTVAGGGFVNTETTATELTQLRDKPGAPTYNTTGGTGFSAFEEGYNTKTQNTLEATIYRN